LRKVALSHTFECPPLLCLKKKEKRKGKESEKGKVEKIKRKTQSLALGCLGTSGNIGTTAALSPLCLVPSGALVPVLPLP
jgi:hypothetical protein